jgi:cytochrome c biogenesis protein CcdA
MVRWKEESLAVLDVPVVYALGAGMLALINPCGAAMLPAYIGYQMSGRDGGEVSSVRAAARGLTMGVVTTLGFVAVFGTIGAIIAAGGRAVISVMPYAGLGVGIAVVTLALWLLVTRRHFGIWAASRVDLNRGGGVRGVFLFGVAYALASLSCALPIFLVVVVSSLTADGFVSGFASFLSYSLGMGGALVLITLVVAISQQTARVFLRRVLPLMDRVGNLVLLGAGGYIIYYWTLGTGGQQFLFA